MTINLLITSYNHEKYIEESIDSALNQSYKNLKILAIDAGSTDKTTLILTKYKKYLEVHQLNNSSPSQTLNFGIAKCKEKYIAFQSGDDISHPYRIEKQIEEIKYRQSDLIFTDCKFINKKSNQINYQNIFTKQRMIEDHANKDLFLEAFNTGNFFCAPSAVIKREIFNKIGMFNPLYFQLQDYDFWLRALMKNLKISFINEKLIFYRIHDKNLSSPKNDNIMHQELSMVLFNILKKYVCSKNTLQLRDLFGQYIETTNRLNKFSIIEIHNILKNHRNKEVQKFAKFLFFINLDKIVNEDNTFLDEFDYGYYLWNLGR